MSSEPPRAQTSLVSLLADRLNLEFVTYYPHPEFVAEQIDLSSSLYFNKMEETWCIDFKNFLAADEEAFLAYRELLSNPKWRYRLKLLTLRNTPSDLAARFQRCDNTVIVTEEDLNTIAKAKSFLSPLRNLLRTQLPVDVLSPYQYTGAVTGNRFMGREVQLSSIIRHPEKAYLVTGARQSGKTSLLMEAQRRLQSTERTAQTDLSLCPKVIYVDCKRFSTVSGTIQGILKAMGVEGSFSDNVQRWESPSRWPAFYKYLRTAVKRRPDKRLHIFLDEYDAVVDLDRKTDAKFTWNLRAMHQDNAKDNASLQGIIQFVFAGSKELAKIAQNNSSELYNFVDTEGCRLTNFEIVHVRKLLEEPMQELGFTIDDPTLVAEELLHETAGRPASVQHVCAHVVTQLREQRKAIVTVTLLRQITQSSDYFRYYKGTLHENAGTLANLVLSIVSKAFKNSSFSQEDVADILHEQFHYYIDPAVLFSGLDDLVNSGFLILSKQTGERYDIALPVIKRIYGPLSPESYIPKLLEEKLIKPDPRYS